METTCSVGADAARTLLVAVGDLVRRTGVGDSTGCVGTRLVLLLGATLATILGDSVSILSISMTCCVCRGAVGLTRLRVDLIDVHST